MNLRERFRLRRDLIQRARQAAKDGKTAEEFEQEVIDAYGEDRSWSVIFAIFMQLLPLLLEWFRDR